VPLVRVELFERRLTPELESKLIERMTETLLEVLEAPELKAHTWVIVEGHDAHRWGRNAKPWDEVPESNTTGGADMDHRDAPHGGAPGDEGGD
jgi:phenylpyruvate tautomerase PptA (4-oxalocrotonate tautomerase family)